MLIPLDFLCLPTTTTTTTTGGSEEGTTTPEPPMDKDTRRAQLRRLRASYQSSTSALRRTPLYIPRSSFVSQREIRRLPTFVCYNDIVTSEGATGATGATKRTTVHMRGVTIVNQTWLPAITVGTTLCEFPPPAATDAPQYNATRDTMTCVTRPRFGTHRWELPLTTVALSRTTIGVEQECRWFLRCLLEGKVIATSQFLLLKQELKISPAIITHSRFHGLGLQLVNVALEHDVVNLASLKARLAVDPRFMATALKMWAKGGGAAENIEEIWRKVVVCCLKNVKRK